MSATMIISILLAALVTFIIVGTVRNKKKGKACCGGCGGCPMASACHAASGKQHGAAAKKS